MFRKQQGMNQRQVVKPTKQKQKKYQNSDVFIFPLSSEGLETVGSVFELMSILQGKFKKAYKNRTDIRCQYQFSFPRFYSYVQGLQYIKLVAHCKFCSHQLVYFKNLSFEQSYKLIAFRKFHVHTKDPKKIREVYVRTCKDAPRVYRYEPYYLKILRVKNQKHDPAMNALEYLKSLPIQIKMKTKLKLVTQRYGITQSQFNNLMRRINSQFSVSLAQLFKEFDEKDIEYAYVPQNILDVQKRHLKSMKSPHYALRMEQSPDVEQYQPNERSIYYVDIHNPSIPNILIIVTPRMKQLYREYGHYIGFDLTFSVIKERPTHHKQYLVGIFGGTTQSKRMLVYGIIITNSQTVEAYKYIFTQFFRIVGSCPSSVLTDQQKAIYHALKQLKSQGIFTGNHLFDMFHILKKFRKSSDGNCFQLYRKIMHVTSRSEYRKIFRELIKQINNDKQLNVLRIFDANCQMYCFSQIPGQFVGAGISNSINQKFHDMLKSNLPFQSRYMKATKVILYVSTEINDSKQPDLEMNPLEQTLNIPFLKPYRTLFSRTVFKIIVREVGRAGRYSLLTDQEERRGNFVDEKREEGKYTRQKTLNLNKDSYTIMTNLGPYNVFKKYKNQQVCINDKITKNEGKWHCLCQYEEKSGIICSHLARVLIHIGKDFMENMHSRWLVKQQTITKRLLNYKYVAKFLALRSRHKIRVKGYKSNRNIFDSFRRDRDANKSENSFQSSQISSITNDLQFKNNENSEYESEFGESASSGFDQMSNMQFKDNLAENQSMFGLKQSNLNVNRNILMPVNNDDDIYEDDEE